MRQAKTNLNNLWLPSDVVRNLTARGCEKANETFAFVNLYRLKNWMKKIETGNSCAARKRPLFVRFKITIELYLASINNIEDNKNLGSWK